MNFPTLSREWCFTRPPEEDTKLQRAQNWIIQTAAATALVCRWPFGLLVSVHLWQTVTFVGTALIIGELSFVAFLSSMVAFIRVAHRTAQITGWEHPDSPERAFSPEDYSKDYRQFDSPANVSQVTEPGWTINNSSTNATHQCKTSGSGSCSITFNGTDITINGKKSTPIKNRNGISIEVNGSDITIDNSPPMSINSTESSFMGFSPVALGASTWLKTRSFATSVFSNSTQSNSSSDSFGRPSVRRGSALKYVQNVSDLDKPAAVPDLLTGTPRP